MLATSTIEPQRGFTFPLIQHEGLSQAVITRGPLSSILLTVYHQQNIIGMILENILRLAAGPYELLSMSTVPICNC